MTEKIQIFNAKIVLPESVITGSLEIENGCISYVGPESSMNNSGMKIDAEGKYVLPGFIDIHTNGIAGFDLTNGVYSIESGRFSSDEDTYHKGLDQALYHYAKTGVTRAVLTSLAAPVEQLKRIFGYVKKYINAASQSPWKNVFSGLFVEGTFMKLIDFRGAHNPGYFNQPSIELFDEMQEAGGGLIKIVNVVPEWDGHAVELIKYLSSKNIICAAGHTGAAGRQYENAIENGLRLAVHFLNGPTGSSSKSLGGGGAVEAVLRSENMVVEIIVDGYHVDKAYVLDTIKRKGFDKVAAITDSMFAAEFPGLKEFEVCDIKGRVSRDGKYLQIADRENSLFGSKLIMSEAFNNLLNWFTTEVEGVWYAMHSPMDFNEALVKASAMCSGNPARVLGIFNSYQSTGSIETGKYADIIIGEIVREDEGCRLKIDEVFLKGEKII